jgi:hypothetical protein
VILGLFGEVLGSDLGQDTNYPETLSPDSLEFRTATLNKLCEEVQLLRVSSLSFLSLSSFFLYVLPSRVLFVLHSFLTEAYLHCFKPLTLCALAQIRLVLYIITLFPLSEI